MRFLHLPLLRIPHLRDSLKAEPLLFSGTNFTQAHRLSLRVFQRPVLFTGRVFQCPALFTGIRGLSGVYLF